MAAENVYLATGTGYHSYSIEERRGFSNYVNELLAGDPDLADDLPLDPDSNKLFDVVAKGMLLPKLINAIKPGTINESKLSKGKNLNSTFRVTQNHNLAIQGCKQIGCKVVSIGAEDLSAGKPHLILGLIWQVVKVGLLSKVNLDQHPELVAILEENEDVSRFMNVAPEVNLLRWFNYHLKKAGHPRKVNNFTHDIKDGENYLVLLEQIAPHVVPKGIHHERDPVRRAELVCHYAKQLGCGSFVTPKDILDGNEKLNLAFTAYLFNKLPGLEVVDDDVLQQQALKEAELLLQQKYEQDEAMRRAVWKAEEEQRIRQWEMEEQERKRQWEAEEKALRDRIAAEQAMMKAAIDQEQQAMKEKQAREEAERRRLEYEAQDKLRQLEEERRRLEAEREQARLAEEERRRHFEAEARLREARAREEEEKRREEEYRRMEEERRRQFEEDQRRQEEERRKMEEEMARQAAWDEYNRQQAAAAAAAAEEEERRRQAAWAQYNAEQAALAQAQAEFYRQQEEAARRAQEEEERRQAAWAQYNAEQLAMQQTLIQQQQAMATMMTTVFQPPPLTTTTVKTTTVVAPPQWPIPRLTITVVRAQRLAKKDKFSKADPYVILIHQNRKVKTTWLKNTQDPVYNQDFDFHNVQQTDHILLQIYDKDNFKRDDFMGEVRLLPKDFIHGAETWFALQSREYKYDKVHGEILLRFACSY